MGENKMRLTDQVRALEEENTRLRAALAAEQDKRRKWQGALNRVEDLIEREKGPHIKDYHAAVERNDYPTGQAAFSSLSALCQALIYIKDARVEARKEASQ